MTENKELKNKRAIATKVIYKKKSCEILKKVESPSTREELMKQDIRFLIATGDWELVNKDHSYPETWRYEEVIKEIENYVNDKDNEVEKVVIPKIHTNWLQNWNKNHG